MDLVRVPVRGKGGQDVSVTECKHEESYRSSLRLLEAMKWKGLGPGDVEMELHPNSIRG